MLEQYGLVLALVCAVVAIIYGLWAAAWINKQPAGNERMQEIAGAIQEGARAYLNRQYSTIAVAGVVLLVLIGIFLSIHTAIGFAIGAVSVSYTHLDVYKRQGCPCRIRVPPTEPIASNRSKMSRELSCYTALDCILRQPRPAYCI